MTSSSPALHLAMSRNKLDMLTLAKVQTVMGVARVNGDLAVSRAFGDAQHKQTGGPAQDTASSAIPVAETDTPSAQIYRRITLSQRRP